MEIFSASNLPLRRAVLYGLIREGQSPQHRGRHKYRPKAAGPGVSSFRRRLTSIPRTFALALLYKGHHIVGSVARMVWRCTTQTLLFSPLGKCPIMNICFSQKFNKSECSGRIRLLRSGNPFTTSCSLRFPAIVHDPSTAAVSPCFPRLSATHLRDVRSASPACSSCLLERH